MILVLGNVDHVDILQSLQDDGNHHSLLPRIDNYSQLQFSRFLTSFGSAEPEIWLSNVFTIGVEVREVMFVVSSCCWPVVPVLSSERTWLAN